jgi:hypothetical protein
LFLFLRQICSQPKEELIAQSSRIKDQVMKFYENMMKMEKPIAATNSTPGRVVTTAGGTIASEYADFRLSPTNLLKNLWKLLTNSYSCVVQWLWSLMGKLTFEVTKYTIQICGFRFQLNCPSTNHHLSPGQNKLKISIAFLHYLARRFLKTKYTTRCSVKTTTIYKEQLIL